MDEHMVADTFTEFAPMTLEQQLIMAIELLDRSSAGDSWLGPVTKAIGERDKVDSAAVISVIIMLRAHASLA